MPVLTVILVSYFMIVLDISIVITGVPKIQESLTFSAVRPGHAAQPVRSTTSP
jgi:hypothetical protein